MAYHTSFQFEHILKSIFLCTTRAFIGSISGAWHQLISAACSLRHFGLSRCDYLWLHTEASERAYDVIERCNAIRTCLEMKLYLVAVSNDTNCIKLMIHIRVYKMYTMKDLIYIYPYIDSKYRAKCSLDLIIKVEAFIHFSTYDVYLNCNTHKNARACNVFVWTE